MTGMGNTGAGSSSPARVGLLDHIGALLMQTLRVSGLDIWSWTGQCHGLRSAFGTVGQSARSAVETYLVPPAPATDGQNIEQPVEPTENEPLPLAVVINLGRPTVMLLTRLVPGSNDSRPSLKGVPLITLVPMSASSGRRSGYLAVYADAAAAEAWAADLLCRWANAFSYVLSSADDVSVPGDAEADQTSALLRRSELLFRGTFENAAIGLAHIDAAGQWLRVNPRFLEIARTHHGAVQGQPASSLTHPDDRAADALGFQRLWAGEMTSFQSEKRIICGDGSTCWITQSASLQRDVCGTPLYAIASFEDITQRKAAEDQQRLLIGEINHRVKNTLAMIQSIASQTLRRMRRPEDFMEAFFARLQALSSAHELLSNASWNGIRLTDLIYQQAVIATAVIEGRVRCSGPDVVLGPQIALNLAMVFHEIAANAVEFGSLSSPAGHVDVSWTLRPTMDGSQSETLELIWQEHGGPPPSKPSRTGFGTTLLHATLERGLGAKVQLDWAECGLQIHMTIPLPDYSTRKTLFRL